MTPASSSSDTFLINGKNVRDEKIVCAAFNDHFKSVFTSDDGCPPCFSTPPPSLPDLVILEHDVLNLLLELHIKKSPGPDGIPDCFLKRYAEWCVKYLHVRFARSINEGTLPEHWKFAKVKPLHKSGDKACLKITGLCH